MIVLSASTYTLELVMSAGTADVDVSYVDRTATSYPIGGTQQTAATATTQTICAAPAASTSREIDFLSVKIKTTGGVVTIQKLNSSGSVTTQLISVTLLDEEVLVYTHAGGWCALDANGNRKEVTSTIFPSITVTGTSTLGVVNASGLAILSGSANVTTLAAGTYFRIVEGGGGDGIRMLGNAAGSGADIAGVNNANSAFTPLNLNGSTVSLNVNGTPDFVVNAAGSTRSVGGIRIGADSTNNLLDDASNGAGTATLYIGNASINVTSDVRIKKNIRPTERDALALGRKIVVIDHEWDDPTDTAERNRNSRGSWMGIAAQQAIDYVPWLINAPDPNCPDCKAGKECAVHVSTWTEKQKNGDEEIETVHSTPMRWGFDMQYSMPFLLRMIQQLDEKVTQQAAELAELKK